VLLLLNGISGIADACTGEFARSVYGQ